MNAIDWRKFRSKAAGGDGRKSVTFLWSAALLTLAVLSFVVTRQVEPRDTLLRAVPADAVGYVHSNGYPEAMKVVAGPELPPTFAPDEVAVFWLPANGGPPKKSVLVRWQKSGLPADERRWFATAPPSIHPIDAGTYLISDEQTVDAALAARWNGKTVAKDPSKYRPLASVRELLPIQGFLTLSAFAADAEGERQELVKAGPAIVFGMTSGADGSFVTVVEPLGNIAADGRAPAFVMPPTDLRPTKIVRLPAAPLTFQVPAAKIDPLAIIVGTGSDDAMTPPVGATDDALRGLLTGPFMASVGSDQAGKRALFVADFPGIRANDLAASLSDYFGGLFPDSRRVNLPDGGSFMERYVNSDRYGVTKHGDAVVDGESLFVNVPEAGLSYFLRPDGQGGSIITNDASLLAQPTNEPEEGQRSPISCEKLISSGRFPYLSLQGSLLKGVKNPLIHKLNTLKLVEFQDNSFLICGYPE